MKRINQLLLVVVAAVWVSCVEEYKSDFLPEKPTDVAMSEFLNQYDVLKTYLPSGFMLGSGITATDFLKKETLYSLTVTNFNEITAREAMYHASVVANDGSMNFATASTVVETATQAGLSVYGHTLVWHAQQNDTYLESIIAPLIIPEVIIPPDVQSGTTMVFDFESDQIDKEYPMSGNGYAKVATDPSGTSGNVLHVGGPANQSFPILEITLPEGRILGDYVNLTLDFRASGSTGLYGQGMRMAINDRSLTSYGSPSSFGCPDNNWGRGLIVLPFAAMNLTDAEKELTQFTLRVGSATGSGDYYIDNIKMNWEIVASGKTTIDFESNNLNDTYPMTGNSTAMVVTDPAGTSGKVLQVGNAGEPANQSFPKFEITLPEGRVLGDYVNVTLDFRASGSTGLYGSGMRLGINDRAFTVYGSPSSFGCPDNNWGRGLIILPFANMNLTDEEKALTQFTLIVGSGTGSGNYYIDNIVLFWETDKNKPTVIPKQVIPKTPEEKKEILTDALGSWISGMMEATGGAVKAWDVVNEPMDDTVPTELKTDPNPQMDPEVPVVDTYFYWQDFLGKDYARIAVRLARQYGGNDLKLFVNDYGLETNPAKCDGLIKMIEYWESDGVTKIDGIGTQMHVTCSLDPDKQKSNEDEVVAMLNMLKETGKLIRISALDMKLNNADGVAVNTSNATFEQQTAMSKYYNFIVRKYIEIIPAAQRYGITHWNSVQSSTNIGWWNSSYNRIYTYSGFADGLTGK